MRTLIALALVAVGLASSGCSGTSPIAPSQFSAFSSGLDATQSARTQRRFEDVGGNFPLPECGANPACFSGHIEMTMPVGTLSANYRAFGTAQSFSFNELTSVVLTGELERRFENISVRVRDGVAQVGLLSHTPGGKIQLIGFGSGEVTFGSEQASNCPVNVTTAQFDVTLEGFGRTHISVRHCK